MGRVRRGRVRVGLWLRMVVASVAAVASLATVLAVEFLLVSALSTIGLALSYGIVSLLPVPGHLTPTVAAAAFAVGFVLWLHAYWLAGSIPQSVPVGFEPHVIMILGLVSIWILGWVLARLEVSSDALVVTLVVAGVLFCVLFAVRLAGRWSRTPSEERWRPATYDEDGVLEEPANPGKPRFDDVLRSVRGTGRRIGDAAGWSGYLSTGAVGVTALWTVHVAAASLSTVRFFVGFGAGVGALVVVGHLAFVARAERKRDGAVLRDVTATVGTDDAVPPDLRARIDRLAAGAGVPAPEVRVGATRTPVAVTVGYRPSTSTLVVSRGLLESLDDRELDAVLAHELAHVANRDAAVLTALAVPAIRAAASIDHYGSVPFVAFPAFVARTTSRWCVAVVARSREYAADDGAVAITGDPAALASALETLDDELGRRPTQDLRTSTAAAFSVVPPPWDERRFFDRTRRFVARRIFGTHPPTEDRVERLRETIEERERVAAAIR